MNRLDMQVIQFYFLIIISGGQFLLKTPLLEFCRLTGRSCSFKIEWC